MPPSGVQLVRPDAQLAAAIRAAAGNVEAFIRTEASPACAAFYLSFQELGRSQVVREGAQHPDFAELAAKIDATRKRVERLAKVVAGLDDGAYELAAWVRGTEPPVIGVVERGSLRDDSAAGFALVPIVVVLAAGAALYGAWVLADLYLEAQQTAEQADLVRAQTALAIQRAIASAPNADVRQELLNAFNRAQQIASDAESQSATPSWLSTFGKNLAQLAGQVMNAGGSLVSLLAEQAWPWLLVIALLLGGRERRKRRRA